MLLIKLAALVLAPLAAILIRAEKYKQIVNNVNVMQIIPI